MLTIRELIDHEEFRAGRPEVVSGEHSLGSHVRWVHVLEVPDVAHLLEGNELVLTTGIGFPKDDDGLVKFVDDLQHAGASGMVLELGRYYRAVPDALLNEARKLGFPVIVLHAEIQFIRATEVIHRLVVNRRVNQLHRKEQVQSLFTRLSVEGASADEIVQRTSQLLDRPVLLEGVSRHLVAYDFAGEDIKLLLHQWEQRSRRLVASGRTEYVPAEGGWLVTQVGARGNIWGRLLTPCAANFEELDATILERAAEAIALNRLLEHDTESLELQSQRTLIHQIRHRTYTADSTVHLRALALGVSLEHRSLFGVVLSFLGLANSAEFAQQAVVRDCVDLVSRAAREAGVPALVGALAASGRVGAVMALPTDQDRALPLAKFAELVHDELTTTTGADSVIIGVGSTVPDIHGLRRSLQDAEQVAEAASGGIPTRDYYELADIKLPGLLYLLREDARVHSFVERELGLLLAYDARHNTKLVAVLQSFLDSGRNKSETADALGLSRSALYERLQRIARIQRVDLESTDSCLSLHVALRASAAMRDPSSSPHTRAAWRPATERPNGGHDALSSSENSPNAS
jgi:purine catabolism regulator